MNKERFNELLIAMVRSESGISDLLFIPGRVPQMSCYGRLRSYTSDLITDPVTAEMTAQLAEILMDGNTLFAEGYRKNGSCDCSYAVPGVARFRVNIYSQAGQRAIVMRKLSNTVPQLQYLKVPSVFEQIITENAGLVFITGATGCGKTTTLAAILNEINFTQDIHVVTLEDPVEYVHEPIRSSFSQREYGKDYSDLSYALKAALRQAPHAILVGEIRDRETMEVAITAGETGISFSRPCTRSTPVRRSTAFWACSTRMSRRSYGSAWRTVCAGWSVNDSSPDWMADCSWSRK